MSTDLRKVVKSADPGSWDPLDLGALTREARTRKRDRRIVQGLAGAAFALLVLLAGPAVFRQLGITELSTRPPADKPNDAGLPIGPSEAPPPTRDVPAQGLPIGPLSNATNPGVRTPRGEVKHGQESSFVPRTATPKPVGTYIYEMTGSICAPGCGSLRERRDTYERANGSHQRSFTEWAAADGGKFEEEIGNDYRSNGVYFDSYMATYTNNLGAVQGVYACPDLPASPVRVWPAGTKPGDHFEFTVPCSTRVASDEGQNDRTSIDIIRAETISVGGRELVALFVREEFRRGNEKDPYGTSESYVLPDYYLTLKGHTTYITSNRRADYWLELKSLAPS